MSSDGDIIPERVSTRDSRTASVSRSATAPAVTSIGAIWKILILLLTLGCGILAYLLYMERQQQLVLSNRVANIERKLSVTDESLNQSGAAIQALLKEHGEKIDVNGSEIRKLWVIAHQTNSKDISANKAAINLIDDRFKALQASNSGVKTLVDKLDNTIASITDNNVANAASIEFIEEQLRDIADVNNSLQNQFNAQQQSIGISEQQIEAINESRRQVNRRILDMQQLINDLQNQLANTTAAVEFDEVEPLQDSQVEISPSTL